MQLQKGFVQGIALYSTRSEVKANMDRLQVQDQCCGAESFMDWVEADWVPPGFNPLSQPNLDHLEKLRFWPWSVRPPTLKPPNEFSYEQPTTAYDSNQPQNLNRNNDDFLKPPDEFPHEQTKDDGSSQPQDDPYSRWVAAIEESGT